MIASLAFLRRRARCFSIEILRMQQLRGTHGRRKAIGMPLLPTADIKPAAIRRLEHDPEKWEPVFGKDHAQTKKLESDPIQLKRIRL
jgi:hypothetical protein